MFNTMADDVRTLSRYNQTVRDADECNRNLMYLPDVRLTTEFQEARADLLHAVMHHRTHQAEY